MEWVIARGTQLMQVFETVHKNVDTYTFHRSLTDQPIPTFAPATCKLRPDNPMTSSVTARDIARWRANPEQLVGKCFITTENIMRRTFLIQDYYRKRAGPRFDVIFEDTGTNVVDILDPEEVLEMVEEAELVNNNM